MNEDSKTSQRNILSRLILQKILSSDAITFIPKATLATLQADFLSQDPQDKRIAIDFKIPNYSSSYSTVCNLSVGWELSDINGRTGMGSAQYEVKDPDGNAWASYVLSLNMGTGSSYNNTNEIFAQRAACMQHVAALVTDIRQMVPNPIRVMILSSDEVSVRDAKIKHDAACETLKSMLNASKKAMRHQLRVTKRGPGRFVSREKLSNFGPGRYEVDINDGSKRKPNMKKYVVNIPVETWLTPTLKRLL